jgi:hypothetical protein
MRFPLQMARVAPVFVAVSLAGCATVTRGTTSEVEFISEPPGARVETSRLESCTTPCKLTVSRKDEFQATFKLVGYKDQSIFVRTQVAGAGAAGLVGNAIVGGVIGVGVDVVTGATLEHAPNPVRVTLERVGPATPAGRAPRAAPARRAPAPAPAPTPESAPEPEA